MTFLLPTTPGHVEPDIPVGYALRPIHVFDKERLKKVGLVLPDSDDIDQWLRQQSEKVKNQVADFGRAEEARHSTRKPTEETIGPLAAKPPSSSSNFSTSNRAYRDAREDLKTDYDESALHLPVLDQSGIAQVQVYAWDEPLKLIAQGGPLTPDRRLAERDQGLFEKLRPLGAFRRLCHRATYPDTLTALGELGLQQPHFSDVIDFVRARIALAREVASPLLLPPILLAGPPGVGKTHFSLALAKAMQRPVRRHSFDADQTSSALTGSDRHWSNTKPGLVFEAICLGEQADPVILLDELDKAVGNSDRNNALGPLHSLLEPVTSRDVVDLSVGIRFDASHVFWVATANELRKIPEPIQSRFKVFNLQTPTACQALDLARAVVGAVHKRFPDFEAPPKHFASLVAHLTPREQTQALEQAFALAAINARRHLVRQDLPAEVLQEQGDGMGKKPRLH